MFCCYQPVYPGIFKYADFLLQTVNTVFGTSIPLLGLPLPIGISFYTFQTMSYVIDVYRGDAKAQRNILQFGVYVTMFPQLIAGPILKYHQIENIFRKGVPIWMPSATERNAL